MYWFISTQDIVLQDIEELPKIDFEDLEPIGFYDEKKAHIVDDRVFEKIGVGSCGVVIKAKMKSTGAAVAVKILTDPSKFGNFKREVAVLAKHKHPKLVSVKAFCLQPISIVMEYMELGNLYRFLRGQMAPLTLTSVLQISTDIAQAMTVLHKEGFIHRSDLLEFACLD